MIPTFLHAGKSFDTQYSEIYSSFLWPLVAYTLLVMIIVGTVVMASQSEKIWIVTISIGFLALVAILIMSNSQGKQKQAEWITSVQDGVEDLYGIEIQSNEIHKLVGAYFPATTLVPEKQTEAQLVIIEQGEGQYLQLLIRPLMVDEHLSLYVVEDADTETSLEQYLLENGNIV